MKRLIIISLVIGLLVPTISLAATRAELLSRLCELWSILSTRRGLTVPAYCQSTTVNTTGDVTASSLKNIYHQAWFGKNSEAVSVIIQDFNYLNTEEHISYQIQSQPIAYGDVDQDGKEEAVLVLRTCSASCGVSIAVVDNIQGKATIVTNTPIVGSWANFEKPDITQIVVYRQGEIAVTLKRNDTGSIQGTGVHLTIQSFSYDRDNKTLAKTGEKDFWPTFDFKR